MSFHNLNPFLRILRILCFESPSEYSLALKKWMPLIVLIEGYEVGLRLHSFGGSIKSWGREEFGRLECGKENSREKILFGWMI